MTTDDKPTSFVAVLADRIVASAKSYEGRDAAYWALRDHASQHDVSIGDALVQLAEDNRRLRKAHDLLQLLVISDAAARDKLRNEIVALESRDVLHRHQLAEVEQVACIQNEETARLKAAVVEMADMVKSYWPIEDDRKRVDMLRQLSDATTSEPKSGDR